METIILTVDRKDVYEEVAKTSDYTGSKMMEGDDTVRDRILITDEDLATLGRMWEETATTANERLRALYRGGSSPSDEIYTAELEVSRSFDRALLPSVQAAMRSYFVSAIVGKWYKFSNKPETQDYFAEAAEMMEDVLRKLYSRRRPTRPGRG